jgi:transposase-like protein
MKRRTFSAKQKAAIVLESLQSEQSTLQIAKKHTISPSLLGKWKDQVVGNLDQVFEKQADQEQAKKIRKYEHVITKLTTQNDFLDKVLTHLERE